MWMHWSVRTLGSSSRSPRRKLRGTLHLSHQTLRTEPYWFVCRHIPWVEALWSDCQVIFLVVLHDGIVLPLQLLGMQIYACLWREFLATILAYFLTLLTFVHPAWGLMQWDGFLLWFGPSIWLCLPSFPMNVAGMQSRKTCRCPDRQRYDMIHIWTFQDDGLATVASILIWKLKQRSLSSCSWKWCCRKGSALERPPSVCVLFFLKPLDLDSSAMFRPRWNLGTSALAHLPQVPDRPDWPCSEGCRRHVKVINCTNLRPRWVMGSWFCP